MRISLVFNDWQKEGRSTYHTEEGVRLSLGDFHAGTTFDGEIELGITSERELRDAIEAGYEPLFLASIPRGPRGRESRENAIEKKKKYVLQPGIGAYCPSCSQPALLLCPENGDLTDVVFYVCFSCWLIGQVGVGLVKRKFFEGNDT